MRARLASRRAAARWRRRGDRLHRERERLDHSRTLVVDGAARLDDFAPRDVTRSRGAAIVLARVQVLHPRARQADGGADRLFLDIHVKRVEEQAARAVIDAVDDFDCLRRQVEEARLEPIQRFDDHDAPLAGVPGKLFQLSDEQIEIFLALVRRSLPGAADRTAPPLVAPSVCAASMQCRT